MMKLFSSILVTALVLLVLPLSSIHADELAQAGRQLAAAGESYVMRARLTYRMGAGEEAEDRQSEATATIVDPSGLAILSLMESGMGMFEMFGGADGQGPNIQIKDVKLLERDGRETPYKFVLRDKDLDIIAIAPVKKPEKPLPCLNIRRSVEVALLDDLLTLGRMGKAADNVISVTVGRVQAVVNRPRRFYVPTASSLSTQLGTSVYNARGELVGFLMLRFVPGDGDGFSLADSMELMVLPAADIIKVVDQALKP